MKVGISILFFITVLLLVIQVTSAEENEYGIVRAWFNGQNATVETINDIKLNIGQPIEVKVEVISKIKGDITLTLREPGVTKAFNVINGPSKEDEWLDNLKIETGWSKTYTWTLVPNGAWNNGNAPLNIFVQFNKGMNNKIIQFTIANPYILDEQYTGAATRTTPAPEITGTGAPTKPAPFPSVVFTLAILLAISRWRRR